MLVNDVVPPLKVRVVPIWVAKAKLVEVPANNLTPVILLAFTPDGVATLIVSRYKLPELPFVKNCKRSTGLLVVDLPTPAVNA